MTTVDITTTLNKTFREHRRYTGDGLPNPPSGAPLPVGDPSSGVHNPAKSDIRGAFADVQNVMQVAVDAAESAEMGAESALAATQAAAAQALVDIDDAEGVAVLAVEAAAAQALVDIDDAEDVAVLAIEVAETAAVGLLEGLVNDAVSVSNVPIVSTRNALELLSIPAGLTALRINGTAVSGDTGTELLVRAGSEIDAGTRAVRSADRFLPNGSTDSDDGGWWRSAEYPATETEAVAGVDPHARMDAFRTKQSIVANAKDGGWKQSGSLDSTPTIEGFLRQFQAATAVGAIDSASADNVAAVAQAHELSPLVYYPPSADGYTGIDNGFPTNSFYPSNLWSGATLPLLTDAIGPRWMTGNLETPTSDHRPILWAEKVSSVDRASPYTGKWDIGAAYLATTKVSGAAFMAAVTATARHVGGTGDVIGIRGHAEGTHAAARTFGAWVTASDVAGSEAARTIGMEINMANGTRDYGWDGADGAGNGDGSRLTALVLNNTSSGYAITTGLRIRGSVNKFWTGIQISGNAIMPTDANGNGEAIRIRGAATGGAAFGGIEVGETGQLTYGIRMNRVDALGNSAAIWLAQNHRIRWTTSDAVLPTSGPYITITDGSRFVVNNAVPNIVVPTSGTVLEHNGSRLLAAKRATPLAANATDLATAMALVNDIKSLLTVTHNLATT